MGLLFVVSVGGVDWVSSGCCDDDGEGIWEGKGGGGELYLDRARAC